MNDLPLKGVSVLVVEDEYLVAEDLRQSLEEVGATVLGPASTVRDALAVLEAGERIDAGVLDINLAGEQVFPVADAMSERGVPFIFATGYGSEILPERYAGRPCYGKPFDVAAIARAISGKPPE